jgi:hypothetical protein
LTILKALCKIILIYILERQWNRKIRKFSGGKKVKSLLQELWKVIEDILKVLDLGDGAASIYAKEADETEMVRKYFEDEGCLKK